MEKHDLHHEFPQFNDKIHELKVSNEHFKTMFEEYHVVNNAIRSIESGAEATTDEVLNDYRTKRVHLKDQLFSMLSAN